MPSFMKQITMMFLTHIVFGLLVALVTAPFFNTGNYYLYLFWVVFASGLPDIDTPNSKYGRKLGYFSTILEVVFGHRGFFHSIWAALLFGGAVYYLFSHFVGIALLVGYVSHLLIDGLTKEGVNFIHPLKKLHMAGFIETGTVMEMVVFVIIVALIVMKLI